MEKRTKCSYINDITTIYYKSSKFYSTKVLRKFIVPSVLFFFLFLFFFLQCLTTYIQICISHWYWNILTEVFKIIGLLNIYLLQQILHQKRCYPLSLDQVITKLICQLFLCSSQHRKTILVISLSVSFMIIRAKFC